ncbi:MAG: UDP-N-acetylglucosamine 2-epimerase (non-hydrolyzing) [Pseudomonadota bacterium]
MKVFVIVGTRPEAIKMAPVYLALRDDPDLEPLLISTGQHRSMLDQVLEWFGLTPDHDLNLMAPRQTLSHVMSEAIKGLDQLITEESPGAVLAQGDTATVCAAAIAAFHTRTPFGHVEAGLRTRNLDQPYPEEGYRQMASRIAHWHFCPTKRAMSALDAECIAGERLLVGNTVIDALLQTAARVGAPKTPLTRRHLALITGHRRENHGTRFDAAFNAIARLAEAHSDADFVYPVHLNPNVREAAFERLQAIDNMTLIEPVAYPEMVALMKKAALILTDSGGVQEEAPSFGTPVLVMRDATERQEAVEAGVCELVGVDRDLIVRRGSEILAAATHGDGNKRRAAPANPFGDGASSKRIADCLAGRAIQPFVYKNVASAQTDKD